MYKALKSDLGCPWCGCHDMVVMEDPHQEGVIITTCEWCGSTGPSVHKARPGLTLAGTALEAWDTRLTWEETLKRLKEGD